MYRLYVDEVGTDDLTHLDEENHRYLSLTGVAMKITTARDNLTPQLDNLKAVIFNNDPDSPVILHRSDIAKKSGVFHRLHNEEVRTDFDGRIMKIIENIEYTVITAFTDKRALMKKENWRNKHPYHFLMEVLVEKYVQFLERKDGVGDIMPEGRRGKKDQELQKAFSEVRESGTYYVSASRIQQRILSKSLKIRFKSENIAGLQLCDLLAHPSHMYARQLQRHIVQPGLFCKKVQSVLTAEKYDRGPFGILGYGLKWLP